MNNQEKKQYLSRYRENEREIRRLQDEILRWESLSRRTTTSFGAVGGGSGEDRLQRAVEQIVGLQNRLTAQVIERVQIRGEIEQAVGSVTDERLRSLLRLRYIENMTFERIAVEMNYAFRHVLRMHGAALESLKMS